MKRLSGTSRSGSLVPVCQMFGDDARQAAHHVVHVFTADAAIGDFDAAGEHGGELDFEAAGVGMGEGAGADALGRGGAESADVELLPLVDPVQHVGQAIGMVMGVRLGGGHAALGAGGVRHGARGGQSDHSAGDEAGEHAAWDHEALRPIVLSDILSNGIVPPEFPIKSINV
jgi:hypothetical protein